MNKEYEICKRRGHESGGGWSNNYGPMHHTCKWCGTEYWDEVVTHENEPLNVTDGSIVTITDGGTGTFNTTIHD